MLSMRRASLCAVAVTAFGAPTRLFIRRTEAPQGRFFHLPGRLLWELDHPVDLVDLEGKTPLPNTYRRKESCYALADHIVSHVIFAIGQIDQLLLNRGGVLKAVRCQ
jgi:hypothetical protein